MYAIIRTGGKQYRVSWGISEVCARFPRCAIAIESWSDTPQLTLAVA